MHPHAGMHVEVDPGTSVEEADRIGEQVRTRIHEDTETGYCVIQMEAAKASPVEEEKAGAVPAATTS
jgi:divalent metal cation (Fe/Co/Zn/Cd) transporter